MRAHTHAKTGKAVEHKTWDIQFNMLDGLQVSFKVQNT